MNLENALDLLEELAQDHSVPRNIRTILTEIKVSLEAKDGPEMAVRIDSALQKIEDMSLDTNLTSFARMQIFNLTSLLEGTLNGD